MPDVKCLRFVLLKIIKKGVCIRMKFFNQTQSKIQFHLFDAFCSGHFLYGCRQQFPAAHVPGLMMKLPQKRIKKFKSLKRWPLKTSMPIWPV